MCYVHGRFLLWGLGIFALLRIQGCGIDSKKPSRQVDSTESPAEVIGYLKLHQGMVRIESSKAGPRFTVLDPEDKVLEARLSLEELETRQPGIFDLYRSSIAEGNGILDASLLRPAKAEAREDPPPARIKFAE